VLRSVIVSPLSRRACETKLFGLPVQARPWLTPLSPSLWVDAIAHAYAAADTVAQMEDDLAMFPAPQPRGANRRRATSRDGSRSCDSRTARIDLRRRRDVLGHVVRSSGACRHGDSLRMWHHQPILQGESYAQRI
jgi:hypothetical protein